MISTYIWLFVTFILRWFFNSNSFVWLTTDSSEKWKSCKFNLLQFLEHLFLKKNLWRATSEFTICGLNDFQFLIPLPQDVNWKYRRCSWTSYVCSIYVLYLTGKDLAHLIWISSASADIPKRNPQLTHANHKSER